MKIHVLVEQAESNWAASSNDKRILGIVVATGSSPEEALIKFGRLLEDHINFQGERGYDIPIVTDYQIAKVPIFRESSTSNITGGIYSSRIGTPVYDKVTTRQSASGHVFYQHSSSAKATPSTPNRAAARVNAVRAKGKKSTQRPSKDAK